jgi:hypothetical protein
LLGWRRPTAEVVFVNVDNGARESITLYPQNSRIGVNGESVQVH